MTLTFGWSLTDDPAEFVVGEKFLLARAATNLPLLIALAAVRRSGSGRTPPSFGWWTGCEGAVGGAFVRPLFGPLLLGDMPVEAAAALPGQLDGEPHAWEGRSDLVEAFASACPGHPVGPRLRLHRLETLRPFPTPEGFARPAAPTDHDLLDRWYEAVTRGHGTLGAVAGRIASGDLNVWETGGRVVAVAGHGPRFGSAVRIDPIYTASEYRGHGYATAVVAAVTRSLLAAGVTEVVHVTTPANPAGYRRLGFQPVADYVTFSRVA
ncbi:GNAT family N-acetyltransferase [Actinomadura mexicana]|uniref:Acetyltransferase (GNAT) family protein n=1 Tax=Actinomadura mexicana TaxID=134959 RepID=A0A239DMT1_9ACTN|nr:GNAT family N-acetyltransferase [Actinomadura mexicana]SNS33138.1 Acetyltransferase (GNAT) family protein [Actinomadura mexicana]